jgi:ABC-2 type transport system ATP-binding protein
MFAQAFLHKPKLAFIDEPLINLDPIIQDRVKNFLLSEVKKGHTIFLSTHILEVAEEICDEVAILYKGKKIYDGKPKKDLPKFFLKEVEQMEKKKISNFNDSKKSLRKSNTSGQ